MSNTWSREQVDALAPDTKSLKAAQKLLSPAKWPVLGVNDAALWGECQGSGKKPYLIRIDLSEPAFKCSCPSRKFPCKHGLALFHLYIADASTFSATQAPDWVTEWLDSRKGRQEAKAKKTIAQANATIDPNAQAKRTANREQKVQGGLAELRLWIHDLVRSGLAQVPNKPRHYFDEMAKRLIDAQAPGLARRVRNLSSLPITQTDWTTKLACELGQLDLIIATYIRQDHLSAGIRADVRHTVGWTENQQTLMEQSGTEQSGVSDRWLVLAQRQTEEEQLRVRKSYLWGKASGQIGLLLEFAHGSAPFQSTLAAGKMWSGEVCFFPSNYPQRAAIKTQEAVTDITQAEIDKVAAYAGFDAMLGGYAAALAQNCWLEDFPIYLQKLTPTFAAEAWCLLDQDGAVVPLREDFHDGWRLLAISGGQPIDLIADWDGTTLLPLAIWQGGLTIFGLTEAG